jgi:hypothetical protein
MGIYFMKENVIIEFDSAEIERKKRRQYLLLLLLPILLCLTLLLCYRSSQEAASGDPGADPATEAIDLTELTDQPTELATETEEPAGITTLIETDDPQSGVCLTPCDPENALCDDGLSCVGDNLGQFICWGGTDSSGQYCGPTQAQECGCQGPDYVCTLPNGQTTTSQNDSQCATSTEPAQSACECSGTDYICTDPDGVVESVSYNSAACGGGGGCECRGPDLVCPDGTYAQFNPQCMGEGNQCALSTAACSTIGCGFDATACLCTPCP